jgi:hypothetical protein
MTLRTATPSTRVDIAALEMAIRRTATVSTGDIARDFARSGASSSCSDARLRQFVELPLGRLGQNSISVESVPAARLSYTEVCRKSTANPTDWPHRESIPSVLPTLL